MVVLGEQSYYNSSTSFTLKSKMKKHQKEIIEKLLYINFYKSSTKFITSNQIETLNSPAANAAPASWKPVYAREW